MLGRTVADPQGIEGPPGQVAGLGLLDVDTALSAHKRLEPIRGTTDGGVPFHGYEMHMSVTAGAGCARAFARRGGGGPPGGGLGAGGGVGAPTHGPLSADRLRAAWRAP